MGIFTPWKMATMATLCLRTAVRGSQMVSSRAIATSTIARKEFKMQEPLDHATGVEKWELLAKQQGNDDPFLMKMRTRGKGTKADPNVVDSFDSYICWLLLPRRRHQRQMVLAFRWSTQKMPVWILVPTQNPTRP